MKKLLLILALLFAFPVLASTNTRDRMEADNYGVTKFKVTEKNKSYVLKTPYVYASEKIYDFGEILVEEDEQNLFNEIKKFNDKSDMDLVILTKDLSYSEDDENEDYATDFYDFNDFTKNGIIFFRNTNEESPYFNFYTFGEAQRYFSYNRLEIVLDDIYDDIHSGNYYEGISMLIESLSTYFDEGVDPDLENYFIDDNGELRDGNKYYYDKNGKLVKKINYGVPIASGIGLGLLVSAISVSVMVGKNKMIRVATKATGYADRKSIKYTTKRDNLVNSITTSHYIPHDTSSGGHSGGGFSSSIGHSGGGHSSGGGRHG